MNENRKLAAILAGDIVGFSRLAGTDEDPRRIPIRICLSGNALVR